MLVSELLDSGQPCVALTDRVGNQLSVVDCSTRNYPYSFSWLPRTLCRLNTSLTLTKRMLCRTSTVESKVLRRRLYEPSAPQDGNRIPNCERKSLVTYLCKRLHKLVLTCSMSPSASSLSSSSSRRNALVTEPQSSHPDTQS